MRLHPSKLLVAIGAVPAALLLVDAATSTSSGRFGHGSGSLARQVGCGPFGCHGPNFPTGPKINVVVSKRVLASTETANITVNRGTNRTFPRAGFNSEINLGTLVAGSNNQVDRTGRLATHRNALAGSWAYSLRPGTTTGVIRHYTVVNHVNANGRNSGDAWTFNNTNAADAFSTPEYLYVTARNTTQVGVACQDGNENDPVLGAKTPPQIGTRFTVEAFGLPPAQSVWAMAGLSDPKFNLTAIGVTGCTLHSDQVLLTGFLGRTTGTNSQANRRQATGSFAFTQSIPNAAGLRGLNIFIQVAVVDADSKRPTPFVDTNGLRATIF